MKLNNREFGRKYSLILSGYAPRYHSVIAKRETFCGTLLCLCGRNDGYLELRIRNK